MARINAKGTGAPMTERDAFEQGLLFYVNDPELKEIGRAHV